MSVNIGKLHGIEIYMHAETKIDKCQ